MLLLLRYKLTSELLAEKRTHTTLRIFQRTAAGRIRTSLATWEWALKTAAKNFGFARELDMTSIRPEPTWFAPVEIEFARTYMNNGVSKRERFQCVPSDCELEHRIVIAAGPDSQGARQHRELREPDIDETLKLFEHIGYFLGLSPWGNRYGHGRFTVTSLTDILDASIPDTKCDPAFISDSLVPGQQRADGASCDSGDPEGPDIYGNNPRTSRI